MDGRPSERGNGPSSHPKSQGIRTEHLRAADIRAEAPWSGIAQHSFDDLAASLCHMTEVFELRPHLRPLCRVEVIRAKDRARVISIAGKVDAATRQRKAEMVEWMLVWLSDPALFPTWVEVRQRLSSPDTGAANDTANSDDPPATL